MKRLLLVLLGTMLIVFSMFAGSGEDGSRGTALGAKDIDYEVSGTVYQGYYVGAPNTPLVMLVHDWDGITDYEKERAQMLSDMGYSVFLPDLFGKGVRPTETSEKRHQTGLLYADRDKMRLLVQEALKTAQAQGHSGSDSVLAGYCFGGAVVLEMARSGADYRGFVTFHGGLSTPEGQDYSNVKGDVLVFHGTADRAIPMSQFADLANQLEQARVNHEMVSYGGAPHGFTVFGSQSYREDADRKSWSSFSAYLEKTIK